MKKEIAEYEVLGSNNNDEMKENFDNAIKNIKLFDPKENKRRLFFWIVRTALMVLLYFIFWSYIWVRYTLIITIPLSLFSLITFIIIPYYLQKKIEKIRETIERNFYK